MKKVLFILGTRPEAIKLAPLIHVFKESSLYDVQICVTAQHREMLDNVLDFFDIKPDYDLDLMEQNQNLLDFFAKAVLKLNSLFSQIKPDLVFVQGDTTTVLVGALVAFYSQTSIAHIEAGLRTFNKKNPFPEEANRILTSHIANFHFAPTAKAVENLKHENIFNNVFLVGNTIQDALYYTLNKIEKEKYSMPFSIPSDNSKKVILVTCHRRENLGLPLISICEALKEIAKKFTNILIVYPVHLNPNITNIVNNLLNEENIILLPPLSYPNLVQLITISSLVLTDSGGIQEEATILHKFTLVLRNITERTEGIDAHLAKVIGTDKSRIIAEVAQFMENDIEMYESLNINYESEPFLVSKKIYHIIHKNL
ncbi:MAG: UDP-N-acetylglucosamine 2-epimerase (non-hydrolyzing) [Raineya sp.]|jgi:UDP-N-acetylglucosamine 2-epimerase (non-hydrolysing)|nr:UDP-N-acetylglucosamine 2-epimerase (non-hydrolyzing) [Raineya sp.]